MMSKHKLFVTTLLLLMVAVLAVGCSKTQTQYQRITGEGYQVSVRFDANGGQFTTNTQILTDSYDITGLPVQADGKVHVYLLPPESETRNPKFTNTLSLPGKYFLAGWYTDRQETVDASGNTVYTYGKKWDFEKDYITVDPNGSHTADTPVQTLYALWLPAFQVEFYNRATGELLDTMLMDFSSSSELELPAWNEATGELNMHDFPKVDGMTFAAAYLDAQGNEPITGTTVSHTGSIDAVTGQAKDEVMKLYLDYEPGSTYHIFTAKQFAKHCRGDNKLVLCADLDFQAEKAAWTLTDKSFSGIIQGNGYALKNIEAYYESGSDMSAGIFGTVEATARICDLKLENPAFIMEAGPRKPGTTLGLFAGTIRQGAVLENITIQGGKIQVSSEANFGTGDYSLAQVCPAGDTTGVTADAVTAEAIGKNPGRLKIEVDELTGLVTVIDTEATPNP